MTHNEEMHRKLWNWLADNPRKEKKHFFKYFEITNPPIFYCYACSHAIAKSIMPENYCVKCPLCNLIIGFGCLNGLCQEWCFAKTEGTRSAIARQIAELPWIEKE